MFQAHNTETVNSTWLEKLLCPWKSLWRQVWQGCVSQHNSRPDYFGLSPVLS